MEMSSWRGQKLRDAGFPMHQHTNGVGIGQLEMRPAGWPASSIVQSIEDCVLVTNDNDTISNA
jgi:hypothetical protein